MVKLLQKAHAPIVITTVASIDIVRAFFVLLFICALILIVDKVSINALSIYGNT